ncbi:MAG: hypothetical protein EOM88_03130 [Clostridia bacterium]|nr:hypothetical protein [Clostridia bacterium]
MKKIFRFLKTIARLISILPLAGRLAIKPLLFGAYGASGFKKVGLVSLSYFLLAILILGHSYQAKLSYGCFNDTEYIAVKAFMLLYMSVNILVTYVQFFLACRLTAHCFKNRHMFQEENNCHVFSGFAPAQMLLFMIVTISGQIAFLVLR